MTAYRSLGSRSAGRARALRIVAARFADRLVDPWRSHLLAHAADRVRFPIGPCARSLRAGARPGSIGSTTHSRVYAVDPSLASRADFFVEIGRASCRER